MVYAAYPGLCDTQIERWLLFYLKNTFSLSLDCTNNLFRHTGLNKSISGSLVANNLLWFMHRFLSRQNCIAFSTFTRTVTSDCEPGLLRKERRPPSTVLWLPRWQTPLVFLSRGSGRRKLKHLLQIRFQATCL